ncbi:MAG: acyl-[acyl-carrier-protein] thioesterase [Prevotella sp.]
MESKTGRYEFLAEPFHCDFSKRLFMGHLGNHLLNAADFHSIERGFGMTYLHPIHKTWVLSRLAVEMDSMPEQYERFVVETWIESAKRFFTSRDFRISNVSDNKVYGYGRSVWAMIDTETREPQNIYDIKDGLIDSYVETEKLCDMGGLSRVKMVDDAAFVSSIKTGYCDVDVNGHINSIKYIEHILDLFPLDYYRIYRLKRFDIAYVAESYYGDTLRFYREDCGDNEYNIRVTKVSTKSDAEIETCRCKVKFVKD